MLNDRDLELLDAYTYGDLSDADERSLRDRLATDPAFAAAVREWELLEAAASGLPTEAPAAVREDVLTVLRPATNTPSPPPARPRWGIWLAGLLVLLGLLLFGYRQGWFAPAEPEGVYADLVRDRFRHLPSETLTLGAVETLEERALQAYEDRRYAAALPLLLQSVEEGADSLNLLYAGVSAVAVGEGGVAVSVLGEVRGKYGEEIDREIEFYLELGSLLNREIDLPNLIEEK